MSKRSSDFVQICQSVVKVVSYSNENIKWHEHKIRVKSWRSNRVFPITVANADIGSLKFHLLFRNICLCQKFEHYQIIRTMKNFGFLSKRRHLILTKRRHHFEDVSVFFLIVWCKKIIRRLSSSSVQKITVIRHM